MEELLSDCGGGEQVVDAVLPTDPVEQDLDVPTGEPPGEHLAVVGEDLLGDPVQARGVGEVGAHGPGRGPEHDAGAHHVPGVVVQAGEDLSSSNMPGVSRIRRSQRHPSGEAV